MRLLSLITALFAHPTKASETTITKPPPLDIETEILAIAGAENSEGKVGEHGERGRLQFTATRWYQFSGKPHRWCGWRHPFAIAETERVEHEHIKDLIEQCQHAKIIPTPYMVALMHFAGVEATITRSASAKKKDDAQRAENLYYANVPIVTAGTGTLAEVRTQRNPQGSQ